MSSVAYLTNQLANFMCPMMATSPVMEPFKTNRLDIFFSGVWEIS